MSWVQKKYYDKKLKTFVVEEYTDWGMKKYDGSGKLIAYEKIADDDDVINDNINEEIDEPDEFFYRLYPWEKRKLEEE